MGRRWSWLTGRVMKRWSCLVGGDGLLNPAHVVADLGVDTRLVFLSAAIAPGDNALELSTADHRATGVTLGEKEEPVTNPQLCPEGRKAQRRSSFPRGPRFQMLILHEPNSFPGKSTLILHTVLLFFSSLLLSPLFPQLQVCEAKKRWGTGSSMLPIQPGSFQSSLLLYPSSEGHQDILFAQDLYIFSPEP